MKIQSALYGDIQLPKGALKVAILTKHKGTTAGWKNTFAYNKLIQILVWEIVKPERAMIMGGTWRIPMLMKLLDKNFVKDLKMDGGR